MGVRLCWMFADVSECLNYDWLKATYAQGREMNIINELFNDNYIKFGEVDEIIISLLFHCCNANIYYLEKFL
jgi:hypothetical protein